MMILPTSGVPPPGLKSPNRPKPAATRTATITLPNTEKPMRRMGGSVLSGSPMSRADTRRWVTKRSAWPGFWVDRVSIYRSGGGVGERWGLWRDTTIGPAVTLLAKARSRYRRTRLTTDRRQCMTARLRAGAAIAAVVPLVAGVVLAA